MGSQLQALKQACMGDPEETMLSIYLAGVVAEEGVTCDMGVTCPDTQGHQPLSSSRPDTGHKINIFSILNV